MPVVCLPLPAAAPPAAGAGQGDGSVDPTDDAPRPRHALFVRLSAQIYNTLDDYVRLADALEAIASGSG